MTETLPAVNNFQSGFDKTPQEIVDVLNLHIIGQDDAKRAVAIALRSRWRRSQVEESLRKEITPKNILMIGPTGVGKTEIARRLADLVSAPFIKVEATKFTEVGYVGRDVDSIIRDLADTAIKMVREQKREAVKVAARKMAIERVLDILLPEPAHISEQTQEAKKAESATRKTFREKLVKGRLDDKDVDVDMNAPSYGVEIMSPPGMEEMTAQLQDMFQGMRSNLGSTKRRKMLIKDALKYFEEEEAGKMINEEEVRDTAVELVEQQSIVFIDELDKTATRSGHSSADISREGVQRDLLPLIEGCTVSTRYGTIKTDHILFIASGAFQLAKPSDLIPELQGRLPIRVELNALKKEDFVRILTEPNASLIEQYTALMKTEGLTLDFKADGVDALADIAYQVNERMENIGARRLYTIMERLLSDISFMAGSLAKKKKKIVIDRDYVKKQLANLVKDEDLSRYIL